nr:glycosyltransferase [Lachnospiraceae bacterium]
MMKVCLLNDSFPPVIDGVANTVENYASVMTEEGLAEAVVATPAYPDADYELFPYKVYPYKSIDTTALIHGYRAGNPLNHKTIADIRRFGPDIIHTHCPFSSTVLARLIRTETHAPIVFTYHTKFDYDIRMAVKAKFLQKEAVNLIVKNVSACDEVWTVSKGAGEDLKALGYSGEYRVMNNGVDFDKGTVSDELVKEAIGEKDVPGDIPLFLFVGRIMEYKGIPIIIDAMKKLSESGINYRMVFVGGGTDREKLEQRVKDNGIAMDSYDGDKCTVTPGKDGMSGKIIFVGPVYDRDLLRAWNTRADLFLFPSTYDTNGIVVREAAACGTASVLIRDSCASEGITDGRNGFLINENADSMYDLLKEIAPKRDVMRQ